MPLLLLLARFHALRAFDATTISTENRELPLPKFYEIYSLDYSFFCTFDPRSDADLLRERIRHDHKTNATCPGTDYGAGQSRGASPMNSPARAFRSRCPLHRKRGSLRHVRGCETWRNRLHC